MVNVDGYKWFGKPRISRRGEGGVGFLVRECIAEEVEMLGMRRVGGRGKEALYLCCVYMPTEGSAADVRLKEDVLEYQQKGRVVILGDFNARVGESTDVDDVIGIFGEDTCNRSGNKLISFLNELELVICNGRQCVSEPEWARERPSLDQKSLYYNGCPVIEGVW